LVFVLQTRNCLVRDWIRCRGDIVMILETVFGIILTVAGGGDKSVDPASIIIKGVQTTNKIVEKKKKDEFDASVHEEVYQMTKDYIYKLGRN